MKNIFDVRGRRGGQEDGVCFRTAELSPKLRRKMKRCGRESKFTEWLWLPHILIWTQIPPIVQAIRKEDYVALLLRVVMCAICLLWIAGAVIWMKCGSPHSVQKNQAQWQQLSQQRMTELGIPEQTETVDVLCQCYVWHKGVREPAAADCFTNLEYQIFLRHDRLCLADWDAVWEIPIAEIVAVQEIHRRMELNSWNKEEEPDAPPYASPHLEYLESGEIFLHVYYRIVIRHTGEWFSLLIPHYDIETVQRFLHCSTVFDTKL